MSEDDQNETPGQTAPAGRHDEERESREQLEESGEPKRDKLGNADGAS